jgi:putative Mg2+ transporter-C (MgtC) family protein
VDPISLVGGASEAALRLAVATLIGALIGLNREINDKPAGMRTHALVALGAALITVTSIQLAYDGARMDGSAVIRAVQGVLTGIGFLGGGVILHTSDRQGVHGLTTAASIWMVACLGIATGAGQWRTAAMAVVLTFAVLVLGRYVERLVHKKPAEDRSR